MRFALPALVIVACAWLAAGKAQALGVTRTAHTSTLGQPLDFTAVVRLDAADEVLPVECVQADVSLGDRALPGAAVRLNVDASGIDRRVRVRTAVPVDEPIVSVTLKIGCPLRFSRTFVAFVDPPGVQLAQVAPPAAPASEPVAAAPTPPVPGAAGAAGGAAPTARSPAPAAREPERTRDAAAAPAAVRPRAERNIAVAPADGSVRRSGSTQPVAPARERPVSRLQLDPVAPPVRTEPAPSTAAPGLPGAAPAATGGTAVATAEPAASSPAEAASPVAASAAADDAVLRSLEQQLEAMRAEALETQRAVAALQSRLAQAERERHVNPLVFALAAAVVLLTAGLLVALVRLRQAQREKSWWQPSVVDVRTPSPGDEPATELADAPDTRLSTEPSLSTQPAAGPALSAPATSSMGFTTATDLRRGGSQPAPLVPIAETRREVTVEELIDLEQQAEFFIVLGQDDAAIDVLMGHLRSTGGATPLPYLKLLEIYRRRDDHEAYERIRERFNRRFNAYAPQWGNDLQMGRSLEDYPSAVARLQQVWPDPQAAMEMLESSLLRQEEDVGTYDLPAYREVLFLYSVARDIAERHHPEAVDLLLPLNEPGSGARRLDDGFDFPTTRAPRDAETGEITGPGEFERRARYDTDFSFGSGSFLSGGKPPGRRDGS